MKRTLFIVLAVIAVFLIVGISFVSIAPQRAAVPDNFSRNLGYGGGAPSSEMPAATQAPAAAPLSAQDTFNGAAQAVERLVIENADLAIVVKDPTAKMKEVSDLAREFGGFVVSSNLYQSYTAVGKEVPEATIVIRVPAARLDEALARIKADAVDIQSENRSGQDVTNQYVDLQAQLTAKQAAEKKLLEIMDQAVKAEDVLAVYMQVQNVQTEIEQLKGQIKYLQESAALSAISVRLIAEAGNQPIEVGPWKPQGAAKQAIQDLINFFQRFVEFLIRFGLYTLPALILIAIPLFLFYLAGRAVYRRVRRPKVTAGEAPGEEQKK
jgi:hypothetical protein